MKVLKVLILLFGAAGLALVLADPDLLSASFQRAPLHTLLIVLGWALPAVMGGLALARPPLASWQASAALAGFAVVAIRIRIWEAVPALGGVSTTALLEVVALAGGLVASTIAVTRPEAG